MRLRELLPDLVCLALLALTVAVFFWPVLLAGQWIPRGGGDLVSFLWPMYRFAARSLRAGVVPLWNPHLYAGAPFLADNQSGVFYPINLLVFAVFGEPSYAVMEGLVMFHLLLAGAGAFVLARGTGLGRPAGLAGGIAFSLSDLFVVHVGNLNLNATAAWLPLLLFFSHRALTRRRPGWAAGAGVILAVASLAGHGQMLLLLALALAFFVLYRLVADRRCGLKHARTTLTLGALVVAVGMGGSALTLLPAQEMAVHTGRGHLPFDEATRYSLPPQALIGLLAPGFYGRGIAGFWGQWDRVEVGYAGVATLVLAAVGAGAAVRRRVERLEPRVPVRTPGDDSPETTMRGNQRPTERFPVGFFMLLVPLALLLAMGRHTPLYAVLYRYAPTFDQVRVPARLIVLADLGLAALAAYGLDSLVRRRCRTSRMPRSSGVCLAEPGRSAGSGEHVVWLSSLGKRIGLSALVAAVVLLAAGLPLARVVPPPDRVSQATDSLIVAAALLALSGSLAWSAKRCPWTAWLLPLLLAVDLIGLGSTLEAEPNDPTRGFYHMDVTTFLRRDPGFFRIEGDAGAWQPDAALELGLYDITGIYNPFELAPYQAYRWAMGERGAPLYNLLGSKYVLSDKDIRPGDERLVPVYTENSEIDVYVNAGALPRALLFTDVQIVTDHAAAWDAIHAGSFDPARTVVLEDEESGDSRLEAGDRATPVPRGGHVTFVRYGLNEVVLQVRTPVSAYLVLTDVFYPGWRATVDGVPTEVLRADYAFRAVPLSPGEHHVRMEFAPWTWQVGLAISALTWIGLVIWASAAFWRRLRRSKAPLAKA